MQEKLFRKVSLERLSSPEQLDQLMTITNPRGWIGLVGVFCLLLVLVLWSLLGVVTTKIDTTGIMVRGDGVYQVNAIHQGLIADIKVKPGDQVRNGDIMAYIVTPDRVEQLQQLQAKRLQIKNGSTAGDMGLIDQEIADLKKSSEQRFAVICPSDGQVMQVKVNEGTFITPGETLIDMQQGSETEMKLYALVYLPVYESKTVSPGMDVEVCPDGVRREEYGFIQGEVVSVSQYPVSNNELLYLTGNEELVQQLTNQQALTQVRVKLFPNEIEPDSYQWSSGTGPDHMINSRDICAAAIITSHQRPLDLFLP